MRLVFVFIGFFCLTACASRQQVAQEHDEYCRSIGAVPGSAAYMQCRLVVEQQLQDRKLAAAAILSSTGVAIMNNNH